MRAPQSVAEAGPGAEAIVELLGLGPADYRPGQHPGQGALVGLDGFGEGAETGSAQLIAFGDGLGGIAVGADLDGKADAGGRGGLGRLGGRFRRLDGLAGRSDEHTTAPLSFILLSYDIS